MLDRPVLWFTLMGVMNSLAFNRLDSVEPDVIFRTSCYDENNVVRMVCMSYTSRALLVQLGSS